MYIDKTCKGTTEQKFSIPHCSPQEPTITTVTSFPCCPAVASVRTTMLGRVVVEMLALDVAARGGSGSGVY